MLNPFPRAALKTEKPLAKVIHCSCYQESAKAFCTQLSTPHCALVLQLSTLWKEMGGIKAGVAPPLMISEMEHLGSEAHYLTPSDSLQGQNLKDTSQEFVCVKAKFH